MRCYLSCAADRGVLLCRDAAFVASKLPESLMPQRCKIYRISTFGYVFFRRSLSGDARSQLVGKLKFISSADCNTAVVV